MKKRLSLSLLAAAAFVSVFCGMASLHAQSIRSPGDLQHDEWDDYCNIFRDPNDNRKYTACPNRDQAGSFINGDLDVEGLLLRDTIDIEDPPTYASVMALMRNIVEPILAEEMSPATLQSTNGLERMIIQQHIRAARTVAADVVSGILARRTSIPMSEKEQEDTAPGKFGKPLPVTTPPAGGCAPTGGLINTITNTITNVANDPTGSALGAGGQLLGNLAGNGTAGNLINQGTTALGGTNPTASTADNCVNGNVPQLPVKFSPTEDGRPPTGTARTGPPWPPCEDDSPGPCTPPSGPGSTPAVLANRSDRYGGPIVLNQECPYFDDMRNAAAGSYEDYLNHIGRREGGRYYIRNNINFIGKYQFGEQALVDIGCVVKDNKMSNNDFGAGSAAGASANAKKTTFGAEKWNATCPTRGNIHNVGGLNIQQIVKHVGGENGSHAPRNSEEFLRDPCTQEAAKRAFDINGLSYIGPYRRFIDPNMCNEIQGVYRNAKAETVGPKKAIVTPSGVSYAMHLLGAMGAGRAFEALMNRGGVNDPKNIQGKLWTPPRGKHVPFGTLLTDQNFTSLASALGSANYESLFDRAFNISCNGTTKIRNRTVFDPGDTAFGEPPQPGPDKVRPLPGDPSFPIPSGGVFGPPKPVAEVIHEIRLKAGVDPSRIGAQPSYNEIMEASVERFFDPTYYVRLAQNPGALAQEQAWTEAYTLIHLNDIYHMQEQINLLLAARASLLIGRSDRPDLLELHPLRPTPGGGGAPGG